MSVSIKLKKLAAVALDFGGITSWKFRSQAAEGVAILMYHRVLPKEDVGPEVQAGMYVEPNTLEAHLQYLLRHFEIIPLSRLVSGESVLARSSKDKPLCSITFDDGWHDFYDHAFPILQKHGVHSTVFLPTNFIGTKRWFWTDQLAYLLTRMEQTKYELANTLSDKDQLFTELLQVRGSYETRLERMIARLKELDPDRIESIIANLSKMLGLDSDPPGRAFITWEEAVEMFDSGLVEFGSHTASHPLLTKISAERVRRELCESMEALIARGIVDADCVSFCYPNGSHSAALSRMVQEVGYKLAVITQRGWHRFGADQFAIRRIGVHQDISSSVALFGARIANLI